MDGFTGGMKSDLMETINVTVEWMMDKEET